MCGDRSSTRNVVRKSKIPNMRYYHQNPIELYVEVVSSYLACSFKLPVRLRVMRKMALDIQISYSKNEQDILFTFNLFQ